MCRVIVVIIRWRHLTYLFRIGTIKYSFAWLDLFEIIFLPKMLSNIYHQHIQRVSVLKQKQGNSHLINYLILLFI
jgi:hypothetical protein